MFFFGFETPLPKFLGRLSFCFSVILFILSPALPLLELLLLLLLLELLLSFSSADPLEGRGESAAANNWASDGDGVEGILVGTELDIVKFDGITRRGLGPGLRRAKTKKKIYS